MKKLFALLSFSFLSFGILAQESAPVKTFWDDPFNDPMLPLYALSAMVFLTIILVMVVALYMVRIIHLLVSEAEKEKALKEGRVLVSAPSYWSKVMQKLNASVPLEKEQDIDMGHDFDGIRELDNHLPPWWKWLFIGTIGWAVIYLIIFHVFYVFPLSIGEYEEEVTMAKEQAEKMKASQPAALIDENTLQYTADAAILAKGKIIFMSSNCVACHRADAGGNSIGPNLTDEYWIHGGGAKNVFLTIKNGAVEKGMPAWGKVMSAKDVRDVAFYILSLQNSQPPNPKAPQGERYQPEKAPDVTDSTRQQAGL